MVSDLVYLGLQNSWIRGLKGVREALQPIDRLSSTVTTEHPVTAL